MIKKVIGRGIFFFWLVLLLAAIVVAQERVACYDDLRGDKERCLERDFSDVYNSVQQYKILKYQPSGELQYSYDDVQKFSLDSDASAQAYIDEAAGFLGIARLKRKYEALTVGPGGVPVLADKDLTIVYNPTDKRISVLFIDKTPGIREYRLLYGPTTVIATTRARNRDRVTFSLDEEEFRKTIGESKKPIGELLDQVHLQVIDDKQIGNYVPDRVIVKEPVAVKERGRPVEEFRITLNPYADAAKGEQKIEVLVSPQKAFPAEEQIMVEVVDDKERVISKRVPLGKQAIYVPLTLPGEYQRDFKALEEASVRFKLRVYEGTEKIAEYASPAMEYAYKREGEVIKDRQQVALGCLSCIADGECTKKECSSLEGGSCVYFDAKGWFTGGICLPPVTLPTNRCEMCNALGNDCNERACSLLGENCKFVNNKCVDTADTVLAGVNTKDLLKNSCDRSTERAVMNEREHAAILKRLTEKAKSGVYYDKIIQNKAGNKEEELVLAALIATETGADNQKVSHQGCSGLTQFCRKTAWYYNLCNCEYQTEGKMKNDCKNLNEGDCLKCNSASDKNDENEDIFCTDADYDFRKDEEKNIEMALQLLKDNMKSIKNGCGQFIVTEKYLWQYAIGAHNTGAGNVCKAIRKVAKKDPTWEELVDSNALAEEAECFTPKVLYYYESFKEKHPEGFSKSPAIVGR